MAQKGHSVGLTVNENALRPIREDRPQSLSTCIEPVGKWRVYLLRQPAEGLIAQLKDEVYVR